MSDPTIPQIPQRPKRPSKTPSKSGAEVNTSEEVTQSVTQPVIPLRPKKKSVEPELSSSSEKNLTQEDLNTAITQGGSIESAPKLLELEIDEKQELEEQTDKADQNSEEASELASSEGKPVEIEEVLTEPVESLATAIVPPRPIRSQKAKTEEAEEEPANTVSTSSEEPMVEDTHTKSPETARPVIPKRPSRADQDKTGSTSDLAGQDMDEVKEIKSDKLKEDTEEDANLDPETPLQLETPTQEVEEEPVKVSSEDLQEPELIPEKIAAIAEPEIEPTVNDSPSPDVKAAAEPEVEAPTEKQVTPTDESQSEAADVGGAAEVQKEVEETKPNFSEQEITEPAKSSPAIPTRPTKHIPIIPKRPSRPSASPSTDDIEKAPSPAIPARPVKTGEESKKGPPPKPKKLSSKIAAFQQMFNQPAPEPPRHEADASKIIKTGRLSSDKKDFAASLQNVMGRGIALPGMANPELLLKLSAPADAENESSEKDDDDSQIKSARPSVPRRTRGPKGKRLPKLVQESVLTVESSYKVSVQEVWSINFRKKDPEEENEVVEETSDGEIVEKTHEKDLHGVVESEVPTAAEGEAQEDDESPKKSPTENVKNIEDVELAIEELKEYGRTDAHSPKELDVNLGAEPTKYETLGSEEVSSKHDDTDEILEEAANTDGHVEAISEVEESKMPAPIVDQSDLRAEEPESQSIPATEDKTLSETLVDATTQSTLVPGAFDAETAADEEILIHEAE